MSFAAVRACCNYLRYFSLYNIYIIVCTRAKLFYINRHLHVNRYNNSTYTSK